MRDTKHPTFARILGPALIALAFGQATGPVEAAAHGAAVSGAASRPASTPARPVSLVDINSASRKQLQQLPGLTAADADRIVAGRPYLSKADLVSSKVLPTGVYLQIKNRIVARQDPKRPPKAPARP